MFNYLLSSFLFWSNVLLFFMFHNIKTKGSNLFVAYYWLVPIG